MHDALSAFISTSLDTLTSYENGKKEPHPFVWCNIQFARLHAGWVFCRMSLTSSLRNVRCGMVRRVSLRLEEFGSSFWKITIKANFNHRNFVSQYICTSPYRHQPLKTSMIMSLMQFQFSTSFIEHVYSYIRIFLVIF